MEPFKLTHEVEFPNEWPSKGVDCPTGSEEPDPPLSPQPYALQALPPTASFTPTSNLYTGPRRWSQVYHGVLDTPGLGTINAVLKIYVWDHFPHVQPGSDASHQSLPAAYSQPNSYRKTEELMAWTESWAYRQITPLQGTIVPQFYGTYLVRIPGESKSHFAISMSFVNGTPFRQRCMELSGNDPNNCKWYPLALKLYKSLYKLQQSGLCDLDIRDENVLVVSSVDGVEHTVFFDFANARPTSFGNEHQDKIHRVEIGKDFDFGAVRRLIRTFTGYLKPEQKHRAWEFVVWAQRNHGNEMWIKEWALDGMNKLKPNKRN